MSDEGRQSFMDKAGAALKPDSQKSTTESMGDSVKGKADNLGSSMQPDDSKSTSQKAGDESKGMLDQAKDAVGMGK